MKIKIQLLSIFYCCLFMSNLIIGKDIKSNNEVLINLNSNSGYPITNWTGQSNVTVNSSTSFTKNGLGWSNNASFVSDVRIPCGQDGFIEHIFTKPVSNRYYMIGLSDKTPYPSTISTLDYAWSINPTVVESRIPSVGSYITHSCLSGQNVVRIEKIGSLVYFRLNGVIVSSGTIDPNKEYYVEGLIKSSGSHNIPVTCSHQLLTNLPKIPITNWTGQSNITVTSSTSFTKSGWGWSNNASFVSELKIPSKEDGFIEHIFTMPVSNRYYMIGLSDKTPYPSTISTLDYAWSINPTAVESRIPSVSSYINHSYLSGQNVVRIEKIGCYVYFKLNGVIISSGTIDPNKDYYVEGLIRSSGSHNIPVTCSHQLNITYATLNYKLSGGYYLTAGDNLFFKYFEEYNDGALNFHVYDESNNEITAQTQLSNEDAPNGDKKYGSNRFKLDISSSSIPNGYYILEVINDKNEIFKLKFKK